MYDDWVIAAITVGSLTGAILAGAYAIEQRSQRQAQQRRAEEAELWLLLADEENAAVRERLANTERRHAHVQALYVGIVRQRLADSWPIVLRNLERQRRR